MSIPKRYIDKNKRLRWSFFIKRDGSHTPAMEKAMDVWGLHFVRYALPHVVEHDVWDHDKDAPIVPDEWFRDHCRGAWTVWSLGGDKRGVFFQDAVDAVFFKLRWG